MATTATMIRDALLHQLGTGCEGCELPRADPRAVHCVLYSMRLLLPPFMCHVMHTLGRVFGQGRLSAPHVPPAPLVRSWFRVGTDHGRGRDQLLCVCETDTGLPPFPRLSGIRKILSAGGGRPFFRDGSRAPAAGAPSRAADWEKAALPRRQRARAAGPRRLIALLINKIDSL